MDPASRPFCSDRCRMADLGRWLSEDYRIPGDPLDAPEDAPAGEADPDGTPPDDD
jgi:endogenous inhibitor of DNA gyrase (YacG/DUF329 family)